MACPKVPGYVAQTGPPKYETRHSSESQVCLSAHNCIGKCRCCWNWTLPICNLQDRRSLTRLTFAVMRELIPLIRPERALRIQLIFLCIFDGIFLKVCSGFRLPDCKSRVSHHPPCHYSNILMLLFFEDGVHIFRDYISINYRK